MSYEEAEDAHKDDRNRIVVQSRYVLKEIRILCTQDVQMCTHSAAEYFIYTAQLIM